jgi:hypothetical protein
MDARSASGAAGLTANQQLLDDASLGVKDLHRRRPNAKRGRRIALLERRRN